MIAQQDDLLIFMFGFICRSSSWLFRYPDELRNIVQQCAKMLLDKDLTFQVGWEDAGLYECQAGRRREQVKRLLSRKLFYLSCCH